MVVVLVKGNRVIQMNDVPSMSFFLPASKGRGKARISVDTLPTRP
jgi:hypothetical protein